VELRDSWRIGKAAIQVTRSLGDQDVKVDGLTATPEVFTRELTEHDEFLVLACDGLWDTLSNEAVVSIVQVGERAAAVV
jgi:serine/threonine protein phosphatase PrpC